MQPHTPSQPPKQATYAQPTNPITHTPSEQRIPPAHSRSHGDPVPSIRRTADSLPSNPSSLAAHTTQHRLRAQETHSHADVDLEYGVEQQPREGDIARAVELTHTHTAPAQAGAHAGPVGSAAGPGAPASTSAVAGAAADAEAHGHAYGYGEQDDIAGDIMGRKKAEHERILAEKKRPEDQGVAAREAVRARKLEQEREVDVRGAVARGTGDPVV